MTTESESPIPGSPWYVKFVEYWRNRNRVGPGKVELPDCDFFIVGPRRTLRVLRPSLKSGWYYENTSERPESINDNFFTRWSRRPHSSGNCRCSFRQSSRLSTTEEQIISDELNRIRTSLRDAEKNGQDIGELEQRVSANLQKLQEEAKTEERKDVAPVEGPKLGFTSNDQIDEQKVKNKIIKDLEKYINVLLEEILDDTVRYIAGAENTLVKEVKKSKKKCRASSQEQPSDRSSRETREEHLQVGKAETERSSGTEGSLNISFTFHTDEKVPEKRIECRNEVLTGEGYVNRAFIGSTNDPDSLDFYLRPAADTDVNLDCIDSGINSVETVEFQPEQELSLEQSLMRIIDDKLGRALLGNGWEDVGDRANSQDLSQKTEKREEEKSTVNGGKDIAGSEVSTKNDAKRSTEPSETGKGIDISTDNLDRLPVDLRELQETVNESSFEKLRLEFKDNGKESSLKTRKGATISKLREKFCTSLDEANRTLDRNWNERIESLERKKETTPIELEDYRKKWPGFNESITSPDCEQDPRDFVMFRRNKKPMIVFLHGFGSSAEAFEHQLEYFSALGYPCIAPDMLGHGMSSAPDRSRDYHFSKLLKDLDAVLHHYAFKPGQKCVLVAHNYGCSFAAALASKYDNIHQLVLISGGGPTPLAPPSTESAGHCCLRAILAPLLMCGLHRDILYSARGRQHPYCGPEPSGQWPSHMKYILDGMIWPEGDYVFHRRICTPTLLIHGLRDNKVSLVQECQMERTMMKAFLEAIPAAGHAPMTECPEQLNHMIHCFIDLWKNKKW